MKFFVSIFLIISVFCSVEVEARGKYNKLYFSVSFDKKRGVLRATLPNELIKPVIQEQYEEMEDDTYYQQHITEYLGRYLRQTVQLQYSAFPMALGEANVIPRHKYTDVEMSIGYLPKSASQLMVQITSFSEYVDENVFVFTDLSQMSQKVSLQSNNQHTALLMINGWHEGYAFSRN